MDIILIPGFWLDASSWSKVTPALEAAGHTAHPLTLPGLESPEADRSGITLQDHIDAVIQVIDDLGGPVVLVGHSGGGAIAYGAVDARPKQVVRTVYVDSGPLGEGGVINDELPVNNGEIPLPEWHVFDDADLTDLTDDLRTMFRSRSLPQPAGVACDPQRLSADEGRWDVPATLIACGVPSAVLQQWSAKGELGRIKNVEYVDLPTGHWPQFTRPSDLGDAILAAVVRGGQVPVS